MSGVIGVPTFTRNGTLAASASSAGYPIWFPFNILISGTWSGQWWIDASDDNSAWYVCTQGGAPALFSSNGFFVAPNVFQKGLLYRVSRGAGTGTLAWKLAGQSSGGAVPA